MHQQRVCLLLSGTARVRACQCLCDNAVAQRLDDAAVHLESTFVSANAIPLAPDRAEKAP
jgi:hypothetical protein